MMRPPLAEPDLARIRTERLAPRRTQHDYLHLRFLLEALGRELGRLPPVGHALDLFCGAQPYRGLITAERVWGYDLDWHFGRPQVIGGERLPFRDLSLPLVVCTQALYQLDDDRSTIAEVRRVLTPGGRLVVTVPRVFRRELANERKYRKRDLVGLLADFEEVEVRGAGGPGTGLSYIFGHLAQGAARRRKVLRPLLPALAVAFNLFGSVLDLLLTPLQRHFPALLIVTARRPAD